MSPNKRGSSRRNSGGRKSKSLAKKLDARIQAKGGGTTPSGRRKSVSREDWAFRLFTGTRGTRIDYALLHSKVDPTGLPLGVPISGSNDWFRLDRPREDILSFKNKSGRISYVGHRNPATRRSTTKSVKGILRDSFSAREMGSINGVLFDVKSKGMGGAAGSHIRWGGDSYIALRTDYANDEEVIIHELVHARRHAQGDYVRDRDREEAETDLETMARMKNFNNRGRTGYYQFLPEVRQTSKRDGPAAAQRLMLQLQAEDRRLVTGDVNKHFKGKVAVKNVKRAYPQSHISKMNRRSRHSGYSSRTLENIDRYFEVQPPGYKRKAQVHLHYPQGKSNLNTIKKDLRGQFGDGSKIWEWRDGKRVRV